MSKKVEIMRKESAVSAGQLVKQSVGAMMSAECKPGQWLFGFDPTATEFIETVFKCDQDGTRSWDQHTTEPFLIHTWAAQKILLPETEERDERECVRVILIDPEGETLSFVSAGVVGSLDMIRTLVGDGPFDPPLPVTVRRIETGAGRQILKLMPDLKRYLGRSK